MYHITIYDLLGRNVHRSTTIYSPGIQEYTWTPQAIASGIYFLQLSDSRNHSTCQKIVFVQ